MEKLLERLRLICPRKKIFFIYTHNNAKNRFKNGLKANTEISYFCHKALEKKFKNVFFLRLEKEKPFRLNAIRPSDVVIGHIGETFLKASEKTKRLIAFYPWAGHEDRSTKGKFNCLSKEEEWFYLEKAASIILLTSEYNKKTYIEKRENFWFDYFKERRVRIVHQPIDLTVFKRVKWDYKTSNFFYVGNNAHMKRLDDAKQLVKVMQRNFYLYGSEGEKLDNLNLMQVMRIASQADFFIQPGMWEGQCVSIMEAAARGFIPIVSEQTGYPYDHPFLLRYADFDYNKKVLEKLLKTSGEERKVLADFLYNQLVNDEHHNSWHTLTKVLIDEVANIVA